MSFERISVLLTEKAADELDKAAELTGDSKTDTINRAIQMYYAIERERLGVNAEILIRYPDGNVARIELLARGDT